MVMFRCNRSRIVLRYSRELSRRRTVSPPGSLFALRGIAQLSGQPVDDSSTLLVGRLLCLLGRHLAEIQLVENILIVDQRIVAVDVAGQLIETPVTLLFRTHRDSRRKSL